MQALFSCKTSRVQAVKERLQGCEVARWHPVSQGESMLRPYDKAPPPYTPPRKEAAEGEGDATIDLTAGDAACAATLQAAAETAAMGPPTAERAAVVARMQVSRWDSCTGT